MKMKYVWDEFNGYPCDLPDNTVIAEFDSGDLVYCWQLSGHQLTQDDMTRNWKVVSYCVAVPDDSGEDYE